MSKSAQRSVAVGDLFSFPLTENELGLCLVVAAEKPRGPWDKHGRWRVVACEWTGGEAELGAALKNGGALEPMRAQRLKNRLAVQSIGGPPPEELRHVGTAQLSALHRAARSPTQPGAWQWFSGMVLAELTFRRDPQAALANAKTRKAEVARKRRHELKELQQKKDAARSSKLTTPDRKTLTTFSRTPPLASWKKHHPEPFVTAVRKLLQDFAAAQLAAVKLSIASLSLALQRATKGLNACDKRFKHPIQTPDAEELVEALLNIAIAAGLSEQAAALTIDEARAF